MLRALFGPNSLSASLRGGLEETSATHRAIGDRVARSLSASSSDTFSNALNQETAKLGEADLQREMVALADTQLRYETEAKLLQQAYSRLRTSIRDHA